QKLQERFADRLGKDLYLISITVDPTEDGPAQLKRYADRVHARPGWFFLTGKKADVEFTLKRFGQSAPTREAHSNVVVVGKDATGLWKKAMGLAKSEPLARIVESVLDDRGLTDEDPGRRLTSPR